VPTVFHVSDLHFGWPAVPEQIEAIERLIQESSFEVVAISGDLTQRAKDGKGGVRPGGRSTPEIAAMRGIPAGDDSISPNRHRDAANTTELLGGGRDKAEVDADTRKSMGSFAALSTTREPNANAPSQRGFPAFGAPYLSQPWHDQHRPPTRRVHCDSAAGCC